MRTEGRGGREIRGDSVCGMMSGSTCKTLRTIAPTYTTALATGGIGAPYPVSPTAAVSVHPLDSFWMVSGTSGTKTYADTIKEKDLSSCGHEDDLASC